MIFRLVENIEDDVKKKKASQLSVITEVSILLEENGFESSEELNGVSFTQSIDRDEEVVDCQFYLDTDSDTYFSYVSSTSGDDKTVSFQQKGPFRDAVSATSKFLKFLETV
jgi:hypothetical protein